ncbi:4'-phosphopantetheinyl transferase family protein [Rheinheimera sp.]|uniref:4'-phosphopantetheinyl transferase family protein n=1 Tax=Rheinheimera sp. TaxID=1869214 RepID=UPI002FDEAFFD
MPCPPFRFLSELPVSGAQVPSLSEIQLFCDNSQQLLLACCGFSQTAFRQTDYTGLMIELPPDIADAVPKRQIEYLAGRYLSRILLQHSGLFQCQPPQLGVSQMRAPAWPPCVTGSITHHQNHACAVLLTRPLAPDNFIGVDTELWLSAQQALDISISIHRPAEQEMLLRAGFTAAQATTLLFSAKEALFKAVCPFVGEYFGFDAAELTDCSQLAAVSSFTTEGGWLELQLTSEWVAVRSPQRTFRCWFSCSQQDVITLVCSDAISDRWQCA